ncbi:proline-rich protein PRCC [Palaemon carinicauda]|uniref:proline-rich protein PRCC n=1 Tax=Palaemon carinicauda TaxID=392227 RepID=UPI0035B65A83
MALVAYSDDSDIGSESEVEEQDSVIQNKTNSKILAGDIHKDTTKPLISTDSAEAVQKSPSHSEIPSGIDSIIDEDETRHIDKPTILSSIPAAVPIDSLQMDVSEVDDELTDVPSAESWINRIKETGESTDSSSNPDTNKKKSVEPPKKKAKVKFIVPALSEFAEDDDEEEPKEEPERKKVQPSSKGSGLFSFLPEPKHLSVKETKRQLIPHILTKPPPVVKSLKPTRAQAKMVHGAKSEPANDSDDEDVGTSDFFSLSSQPSSTLDGVTTVPVPAIVESLPERQVANDNLPKAKSYTVTAKHGHENQINHVSTDLMTNEQPEESQYSFQHDMQPSEGPADVDHEAMIRLMGKRRGKGEEIKFIDVSADDALLTRDEWMTKSLTEEKPTHSYSKKREGLPSQKQKQKHQITYLAHQAKERELELKNNWAQNRMTKMQTQAKYGF